MPRDLHAGSSVITLIERMSYQAHFIYRDQSGEARWEWPIPLTDSSARLSLAFYWKKINRISEMAGLPSPDSFVPPEGKEDSYWAMVDAGIDVYQRLSERWQSMSESDRKTIEPNLAQHARLGECLHEVLESLLSLRGTGGTSFRIELC